MLQMLPCPYPLWARLLRIVLAVICLLFFTTVLVQAEETETIDRPDKIITDLPGSGAAGAHWLGPWEPGGPKRLDTRRPEPPAVKVAPPPAPGPAEQADISHSTTPLPLKADGFDHYLLIRQRNAYREEYLGYPYFYPQTFGFYNGLGTGRFWGYSPKGRVKISSGRGFHKDHFGFREGHPGFQGRGFKGGSFRRR